VRGGSIKSRKNAQKTKSIGKCGFEASNHRNYHKSQQKLEKTKEGEIHEREILLSKINTIYYYLPKMIIPNRLFLIPNKNHIATHNCKQLRSRNM
jgi:hypothetical protein